MSRSYRHTPCFKDVRSCKWQKTYSNRKVRRYNKDLSNGNYYRRLSERYDFYEYKSYHTLQDALDYWEKEDKEIKSGLYPWKARYHESRQECINNWKKSYFCK